MLARRRTQRKEEAWQGLGNEKSNRMCSGKDLEERKFVIAHCHCHCHYYYRIVVLCYLVLFYLLVLALRLDFSCLDTIKDADKEKDESLIIMFLTCYVLTNLAVSLLFYLQPS